MIKICSAKKCYFLASTSLIWLVSFLSLLLILAALLSGFFYGQLALEFYTVYSMQY